MDPLHAVIIGITGIFAGAINAVVGSGTLITFPTLLAFGVPPVTANVSNGIGLVPGSVAGAVGYRRELVGQRHRALWLLTASMTGGAIGAVLLLVLPEGAFTAIVPVLILLGIVLVLTQPRVSAAVARRNERRGVERTTDAPWVWPGMLGCGVYGGYFGAAQGILMMAVLGIGVPQDLQRSNAIKNVLAVAVNGVSGAIFIVVADVDWVIVALLAVGSVIGGAIGARVGRRLPAAVLRWTIGVVGTVALVAFLLR